MKRLSGDQATPNCSPQWGTVPPFVLRYAAQFRPGPPHAVSSKKYTADFNEVQSLGDDGIITPSARTAEQTQIARFWVESSVLQWNRIARTVSAAAGLTLWENARLFALLNFALADGYIATFDTKYQYNFWRPITAIREAATDGNADTNADPTWTPPPGHTAHSGLRLREQCRRRRRGRSAEAVLRYGQCRFQHLQHLFAGWQQLRRFLSGNALVHQLLSGGTRKRALADPRRFSFPRRGYSGNPTRPQDRQSCRQPLFTTSSRQHWEDGR